ncbi:MAG: ComEA family DNA-binding protein [Chloroflexi bacterium]|nr:ComEA family DNA-binding protein [Chloroflexota bacterium]
MGGCVRIFRVTPAALWIAAFALVLALVITGVVLLAVRSASPDGEVAFIAPTASPVKPLVVYVTGAVGREGLFSMRDGDRVADAIASAGGLTADADRSRVDGARLLRDGDHIHVSRVSEPSPTSTAGAPAARVNLNTATQQELEALPGIGPVLAKAILDHRARLGRFTSVEQLLDVSGIGPTTLARLRPFVDVP